jgi:hypothetical protein
MQKSSRGCKWERGNEGGKEGEGERGKEWARKGVNGGTKTRHSRALGNRHLLEVDGNLRYFNIYNSAYDRLNHSLGLPAFRILRCG